jgi:hypothetical protein
MAYECLYCGSLIREDKCPNCGAARRLPKPVVLWVLPFNDEEDVIQLTNADLVPEHQTNPIRRRGRRAIKTALKLTGWIGAIFLFFLLGGWIGPLHVQDRLWLSLIVAVIALAGATVIAQQCAAWGLYKAFVQIIVIGLACWVAAGWLGFLVGFVLVGHQL